MHFISYYRILALSMSIVLFSALSQQEEQYKYKFGSALVGSVYTEMTGALGNASEDTIMIPLPPCVVVSYVQLGLAARAQRHVRVRLDDVRLALRVRHVARDAAGAAYTLVARNYPRPGCSYDL